MFEKEIQEIGYRLAKSKNKQQLVYRESVLVVGNGESRSIIDLNKYLRKICIVGCNAIHRDFNIDHLICCDRRMVREFLGRKKSKIPFVYTRPGYWEHFQKQNQKLNCIVKCLPDLPYSGNRKADQPDHWGSGCYAVLLAITLGYKKINLMGFDLWSSPGYLMNNLYKGSSNYQEKNSKPVDPSFWIYQLKTLFQLYPDIHFNIFNNHDWEFPKDWKFPNVHYFDLKYFHIVVADELNTLYTTI